MRFVDRLRARVREESFRPRWLGLVWNPSYIIRRGLWKTIFEFAPQIRGKVLDFGCGSKPYESLFTEAQSYTGVDIEVSGHQHGDSKIDVFYDGEVLPFRDCQFDAVLSFEVFEHVFTLPDILREINRVTKDCGLLLISVPFAWNEHEIPYDYARYTSFGISHLLETCGYEIVKLRKTTTYFSAVWQMLISYLSQVAPKAKVLRHIFQLFVIFPCTITGEGLNLILPKKYEYFCNCVVLARKRTNPVTQ